VDIPDGGAEGVIIAQGGVLGGFTLFVKNGHVAYEVNASGNRAGSIISSETLQPGTAHIVLEFTPDAVESKPGLVNARRSTPGNAKLFVNGKPAGEARILAFGVPYFETLDVGSDLGSPVSPDYASPFRFTGKIETVKVDLK
jgi:arylsulfatase